ncbi:MAG: glycosyltransferase family 39 protein [Nanoarchaeota archaeon]|nr:glycosyltransferase family 39 protein [Nanoarchaeota archaeon]
MFFTILLSWPLFFNLDSYLLPSYLETIHSRGYIDTQAVVDRVNNTVAGLLTGDFYPLFAYTERGEISKSYLVFSTLGILVFGINEVVAHNLFFLFSLFLSGLFMFFFTKELIKNKWAALFSGFLYMSSSYLFSEYFLGHSNLWQLQWIPIIFLFLERILSGKRSFKEYVCLGLFLGIQTISASYYIIYLTFIIPIYIIFRNHGVLVNKKFWVGMFLVLIIVLVVSSPFLFFRLERINHSSNIRSLEQNLTPNRILISFSDLISSKRSFSLSVVSLILSVLSMAFLFNKRSHQDLRKYLPFIFFLFFIPLCMLGPFSKFAPYYWLYTFWPLMDFLRVPKRLFPFFLLSVSILASYTFFRLINNKKILFIFGLFLFLIIIIFLTYIVPSPALMNYHLFTP